VIKKTKETTMSNVLSLSLSGISGPAALFVLTLISGVFVSRSGHPYNTAIFTVHKLIAVAAIFFIARYIYQMQKTMDVGTLVQTGLIALAGLGFVALIVSGALLSLQDGGLLDLQASPSDLVHTIHQIAPGLALIASALIVYLLAAVRS
jgi:hypothetical protein